MAKPRQRTHKHIKPVFVNGKHVLEVYRKDPKTQKTVYLQRHQSVEECCKALQRRFPKEAASLSPTKLRLQKTKIVYPRRIEKVKYIGVTPVVLDNGKTLWRVQKKFKLDRCKYDTQIGAATAVAKSQGITLANLKHSKPSLPRLTRQKLRQIHGPAMALYCKRKPGDVENLELHAKKPKTWRYLKKYPGLLPSFLIAKVPADRDSIIESCPIVASKIKKYQISCQRACEAYYHYLILVAAARRVSRYRWTKSEIRNIGRNNFHWMNFQTMLGHLGILSTRKHSGAYSKSLVFAKSGTQHYICTWNEEIEENLRNHIEWGRTCLTLRENIPTTGERFFLALTTLDKDLEPLVGAQDSEGYSRLWLKRAWMCFLMKAFKKNINFDTLPVRKFIACWPDEHDLLVRLLSDERLTVSENLNTPLAKALKKLKYKDKPELLSMHACLVDDRDAQSVLRRKDSKWVTRNLCELNKRLIAWRRREGIWPHPGIFFPSCTDLK